MNPLFSSYFGQETKQDKKSSLPKEVLDVTGLRGLLNGTVPLRDSFNPIKDRKEEAKHDSGVP